MINVEIDDRILAACPLIQIGLLSAHVVNGETCDELWQELEREAAVVAQRYELLEINQRPAIALGPLSTHHTHRCCELGVNQERLSH